MPRAIRIDFVSDVACPWCAIGLAALEQAIDHVGDAVAVNLHFQPFELNPQMAPEGEDAAEHLMRKYGMPREQLEKNRENIRARGAQLGFAFGPRVRVHDTFDAHRLLHWAGTLGATQQLALKHALLAAYHTRGEDVSDRAVLLDAVAKAGLDAQRASQVLDDGEYAEAVREREKYYLDRGIHGVPAIIFDERSLISGGQPVELFEQALRQIAATPVAA